VTKTLRTTGAFSVALTLGEKPDLTISAKVKTRTVYKASRKTFKKGAVLTRTAKIKSSRQPEAPMAGGVELVGPGPKRSWPVRSRPAPLTRPPDSCNSVTPSAFPWSHLSSLGVCMPR
jgi:hypothetical protein